MANIRSRGHAGCFTRSAEHHGVASIADNLLVNGILP